MILQKNQPTETDMLCDVKRQTRSVRVATGVYQSWWWNFELEFRGRQEFDLDYPALPDGFDGIGVCDSVEQLLVKLPAAVTGGLTPYVISVVRIDKTKEPRSGGWRWHKWGTYIGEQTPEREHLADEPVIETVWTYHVYQLLPGETK